MGFSLPRSLLEDHGISEPPGIQLPPTTERPSIVPFRPSVAIVVVVVATTFSLSFLLLLYAKHCRRQAVAPASVVGGREMPAMSRVVDSRNSGIDREVVETLPLLRFASLVGEKEGLECAVCLGAFEAEEFLRLLPKCRHAFHVSCVDSWLEYHSTCPLCRTCVHPEDILLLCPSDLTPPMPFPAAAPSGRRISGRHSSAGEKASSCFVNVSAHKQRKDGLLLPTAADTEEERGRYNHMVIFPRIGAQERWSDLRPSDLIFLRAERTITAGGRYYSAEVEVAGVGVHVTRISALERMSGVAEDGAVRRWLNLAAKQTTGWLGGGVSGG